MNNSATQHGCSYPHQRVTAGVLAGGRAARMGGRDKGLIELAGRAMIEYVLDALREQADEIVISANRNMSEYGHYGLTVVADRHGGFPGPLAGIASLMATAGRDWLLIVPCDSPRIPADLGARLWQAVNRNNADIAVAGRGERLEPVFALLRCALLGDLEASIASGERKVRHWYTRHRMVTVDFSDCPEMFVNVNTPAQRDELALELSCKRPHAIT